ncbi:MAG: hypothetical protein RMJ56_09550 [Gemmataceae bacterium]|nr:hypothetical protein [Gemmata sp.]MDW8197834.1 hypothetical protein [Gemmataceae bacterium]
MTLRAQLSLSALEARENPGDLPTLGPFSDLGSAPPQDPNDPGLNDPTIMRPYVEQMGAMYYGYGYTFTLDVLLELSSIFNQPIVQW